MPHKFPILFAGMTYFHAQCLCGNSSRSTKSSTDFMTTFRVVPFRDLSRWRPSPVLTRVLSVARKAVLSVVAPWCPAKIDDAFHHPHKAYPHVLTDGLADARRLGVAIHKIGLRNRRVCYHLNTEMRDFWNTRFRRSITFWTNYLTKRDALGTLLSFSQDLMQVAAVAVLTLRQRLNFNRTPSRRARQLSPQGTI